MQFRASKVKGKHRPTLMVKQTGFGWVAIYPQAAPDYLLCDEVTP